MPRVSESTLLVPRTTRTVDVHQVIILFDLDSGEVNKQSIYASRDSCGDEFYLTFTVVLAFQTVLISLKSSRRSISSVSIPARFSRSSFALGNSETGMSFIPQMGQVPGLASESADASSMSKFPNPAALLGYGRSNITIAASTAIKPTTIPTL